MLLICSSEKCYINDLLEKFSYTKEESLKNTQIYNCNYNEHEFIIMTTGYGKINIASSLRYAIDKYKINVILCVGTAGSISDNSPIFTSVIPNNTLQFDIDFMPCNKPSVTLPNLDTGIYKTNNDINECLKRASSNSGVNFNDGIIASSDMYVNNYNLSYSIKKDLMAVSVDTESGSIGQFCYINDIPYSCIKVISNFANNNSIKQLRLYDDEASKIAQRITYKFLKEYYY